ncbi:hypothetical protein BD413DRAFT_467936 [Trametes elegans]|nr:hypothetical protein BD413DRAFT_467936 [Trametes elegans]
MASSPADERRRDKCRLAELVQYKCEPEQLSGTLRWHCLPIVRIFRICQNRPAVELTRYVDINVETGAVQVPAQSSKVMPKGKPWRDVVRYEDEASL